MKKRAVGEWKQTNKQNNKQKTQIKTLLQEPEL